MCTDYTDFNKACPNDSHPFPNFNHQVDRIVGHKILSFLDVYFRYNQISMFVGDKKPSHLMTSMVNKCQNKMKILFTSTKMLKKLCQIDIIMEKYTTNDCDPNSLHDPLFIDMTRCEANGTSHPSQPSDHFISND